MAGKNLTFSMTLIISEEHSINIQPKKMFERQTKAGNQECFAKLANLQTWRIDPWDMLNNFCLNLLLIITLSC